MNKRAIVMKLAASIAIILGSGLGSGPAYGWLRVWYEDITVVRRSELIVVGHLQRGSVISASPGQGFSQYHARLAIASVLKGAVEEMEIPVIIYHGLTPLVGGHSSEDGFSIDLALLYKDRRKDAIPIMDTGSSAVSLDPLIQDAGEDNLWLLRRRSGNYGRQTGTGSFGIVDPQDLQPISMLDYFRAYLSDDPEAGVRAQLALHPEIGRGAQRYLDHLEVQRILAVAEPETRIHRLLPFYIKDQSWGGRREARQGVIECGGRSTPYLQQLFSDPEHAPLRRDIIESWGEMKFEGCVMQLVDLLEEHDQFWSGQQLEEGWWNNDYSSELTQQRRRIYGEVRSALTVLGKLGDERAISAINHTRVRWDTVGNLNHEIVKQCDEALRLIEGRKHETETGRTVS
ncbi:MAG TPA: hypothetical protein VN345_13370 [Blastocatellia bacterium]|nr:hypothetical protein [Blastocatellia bacterium]